MMKTKFMFWTLLMFVFINLSGQDGFTVKTDSLQSDILKQNRKLSIFLPEGYDAPNVNFYYREGGGMKDMGITSMEKVMENSAPKDLNWRVIAYSDEDHGSVPFKSVYDGLRFIFDVGGNFMVYPESGIIPKGTSAYAIIQNNNPNLRNTTDGTEPTLNSPLCKDKIVINKPCTLKVKSVSKKYNEKLL